VRMPRGEWDLALRSDMKEEQLADRVPGRGTFVYRRRGTCLGSRPYSA
jgi:hypothetical protein